MTSSGVLGPENFPPWVRPYLPPPPSPEVLRHIHDTRGPSILAGMIVMSGCAIAAVIARLYARRARKLPFQADDYLMIPALVRLVVKVSMEKIVVDVSRYLPWDYVL